MKEKNVQSNTPIQEGPAVIPWMNNTEKNLEALIKESGEQYRHLRDRLDNLIKALDPGSVPHSSEELSKEEDKQNSTFVDFAASISHLITFAESNMREYANELDSRMVILERLINGS